MSSEIIRKTFLFSSGELDSRKYAYRHDSPPSEEQWNGEGSRGADAAIRVGNISKCYQIYDTPRDRLKQFIAPRLQRLIGQSSRNYFKEFWALRDVSFDIKKGETVGIIGRNGSGKSTLLQIICGTITPTSGSVETYGRIAALLELGSGFNPEFTGRENVYMNGAVLGLSKEEIDFRFDDIAAFADIGEFITQPVKTYSSGMFVRLAFAVNILSRPDIMIVDEALAVGDMGFQAKCMTALTRLQEGGATILFVSHDIVSVKSLCSRAIYLDTGKVVTIGAAANVAELYIRHMREKMNEEHRRVPRDPNSDGKVEGELQSEYSTHIDQNRSEEFVKRVSQLRYGAGDVRVTYVELVDLDNNPTLSVEFNQKVKVRIFFEAFSEKTISVNMNVFDDKKNNITGSGFPQAGQSLLDTKPGEKYLAEYAFHLPLQDGNYSIRVHISEPIIMNQTAEYLDVVDNAVVFRVNQWDKAKVWSKVHLFPELTLQRLKG